MQFSIKSLFFLITVVAGISGSFIAFGPSATLILVASVLLTIGFFAHQSKLPTPFWGCIASVLILGFLMPPVGRYTPSNEELIVYVLIIVLGGYLAYSGIIRGHWATQVLAIMLFLIYTFLFFSIAATILV